VESRGRDFFECHERCYGACVEKVKGGEERIPVHSEARQGCGFEEAATGMMDPNLQTGRVAGWRGCFALVQVAGGRVGVKLGAYVY